MKLQPGDTIRVTKADDVCDPGVLNYSVDKAFDAEWDGRRFLGCMVPFAAPTHQAAWPLETMRHYQVEVQTKPSRRTNIDCMFEQLDAEGAFA